MKPSFTEGQPFPRDAGQAAQDAPQTAAPAVDPESAGVRSVGDELQALRRASAWLAQAAVRADSFAALWRLLDPDAAGQGPAANIQALAGTYLAEPLRAMGRRLMHLNSSNDHLCEDELCAQRNVHRQYDWLAKRDDPIYAHLVKMTYGASRLSQGLIGLAASDRGSPEDERRAAQLDPFRHEMELFLTALVAEAMPWCESMDSTVSPGARGADEESDD
ncbi:MAG: hypothetical protein ABW032_12230 [Burkholderiaceae bacterium]